MSTYDVIVIGAGAIGSSVAFHLARLGAGRVLVLDRGAIGGGTTAQSSGILRTHYSVRENVELAQLSWRVFSDFASYLGDEEASCGLVKCGYLIAAADDAKLPVLRDSLDQQISQGIRLEILDRSQAYELLPIARFDDAALIGYEPDAGYADAYLTATAFARSARRHGVEIRENVTVQGLLMHGARVIGVSTSAGDMQAGTVVSAMNIWTSELASWTGRDLPVTPERHAVLSLACGSAPYTNAMPVFKDLASPGMLYLRSYGSRHMLVSEGMAGASLAHADIEQGDVPLDYVAQVGEQVARRFPAYDMASLASSWTGVYDVTPDWNPVLGPLPGIEGLVVAYGFSGHGFKLSPAVGRVLAQAAVGAATDVPLAPYSIERFKTGRPLVGKYGVGAVS